MIGPIAPAAPTTTTGTRQLYKRPPVVEAVVDIQVKPSEGLDLQVLARVQSGEEQKYPTIQPLQSGSVTLDAKTGVVVESVKSMVGYRFADAASTAVLQAKTQGFSYSRLTPYSRWENWSDEAHRLWSKYRVVTNPTAVHRLAVRYINRIEYPKEAAKRIRDYLNVFPEVPSALPSGVGGLLMRVELRRADVPDGLLILSLGRTEPSTPDHVALLLDLDVIQNVDFPPQDPRVWETIESLHDRENEFFESCITDLARELFA